MIPQTAPVTAALVALVDAADGRDPSRAEPPFAVVHQLPNDGSWGPGLTHPDVGLALDYQITSVDISRAGVEAHADQLRQLLFGRDAGGAFITPLAVPGLVVLDRELVEFGGLIHERGVFNVNDTVRIHVTIP